MAVDNSGSVTFSPLEAVFAGHEAVIPGAFRRQFLADSMGLPVMLTGTMHEIWYLRWLMPVFWLVGRLGMLPPRAGRDIPATFELVPGVDLEGSPYQAWNRTFEMGGERYHFNTRVTYNGEMGRVVELFGPGGVLHFAWEAQFHPPGTLTISRFATGVAHRWGVWWLPRWLWLLLLGRERFAQTVDGDDPDLVHIELVVGHPLLGDIARYRGSFHVPVTAGLPD